MLSAIAAFVVAALTAFLLLENRRLRKAGNAPELVAYLAPHPDGHGGVNFILANVGTGPAFDVKFKLIGDEADLVGHDVMLRNDAERSAIGVIPQNERIVVLFGISFVLYGGESADVKQPLLPFDVEISFKDIAGKGRTSKSRIDIKQFAGLRGVLAKPPIVSAADTLKQIERHLGTIAHQSARFNAFVDITDFGSEFLQKAKGAD